MKECSSITSANLQDSESAPIPRTMRSDPSEYLSYLFEGVQMDSNYPLNSGFTIVQNIKMHLIKNTVPERPETIVGCLEFCSKNCSVL